MSLANLVENRSILYRRSIFLSLDVMMIDRDDGLRVSIFSEIVSDYIIVSN